MRPGSLLLLLTLLLLPAASQAQTARNDLPRSADSRVDVRSRIRTLVTHDGLSLVNTTDDGLSLYASTHDGRVVDYIGFDDRGRQLRLIQAPVGDTIYWECAEGDGGGTHCWQVERPASGDAGGVD